MGARLVLGRVQALIVPALVRAVSLMTGTGTRRSSFGHGYGSGSAKPAAGYHWPQMPYPERQ